MSFAREVVVMRRGAHWFEAAAVVMILTAASASAQSPVVINEVMFNPTGPDSMSEWAELVNTGPVPVLLAGWCLTNVSAEQTFAIPPFLLPPGAFLVIRFGSGTDDVDFSDGKGTYHTNTEAPVFANDADACALFAGPPSPGTLADFVAWSATGVAPSGPAIVFASASGQWPAPGSFFDTSMAGSSFVVPWSEGPGESIGRNRYSLDLGVPEDWSDHGGKNALVATEGQANTGPVFRIDELVAYVHLSVNQFLWEFGLNVTGAGHVDLEAWQNEGESYSRAEHSFQAVSRAGSVPRSFTGVVECRWLQTGPDTWRIDASGHLASSLASEALDFVIASGDSAVLMQLDYGSWRQATVNYTTPDAATVEMLLTYSASSVWVSADMLQTQDVRHCHDSRGVTLTRSSTLNQTFTNDQIEQADLTAVTEFESPVAAPREDFHAASTKTLLASGGLIGTLQQWDLQTDGLLVHLDGPSSFQWRVVDADSLEFSQDMILGNDNLGYRTVGLRGYHGGRIQPSGEYLMWGEERVTVGSQPCVSITYCIDPWWRTLLKVANAVAWTIPCAAATVVGSPTVVGAVAGATACAAGGVATDCLIDDLCPKGDRKLRYDAILPPPLFDFPRHICWRAPVDVAPDAVFTARNYPNPFNPKMTIKYTVPRAGDVSIRIYDVRGEPVRTLLDERAERGTYTVDWNGTNDSGQAVASGVYFYHVKTGGDETVSKMTLVR